MIFPVNNFAQNVAYNKKVGAAASEASLALINGNAQNTFEDIGAENILKISDATIDISKAEAYIIKSENVVSDFDTAATSLNTIQEAVAELNGALAMDDTLPEKNQTLRMVSDKLIDAIAVAFSMSGKNGRNIFAGTININNLKTVSNFNVDNTSSVNYMITSSADDNISLKEGDTTNLAIRPEDLKDLIAAAHEIKRLAIAQNNVPAEVNTLFTNGSSSLDTMVSSVKLTYDKASASIEEHKADIGQIRDDLQSSMAVSNEEISQMLSDQRNTAQILQAIMSMTMNFASTLTRLAMNAS